MPSYTPSAGSARPPSTAPGPGRRAILDPVARTLVGEYLTERKEQREAAERGRRPVRPWRHVVSIAAIVACGAVWLVPSLGTRPAPAMSAERHDASARLTLFLAAQRINEYAKKHGRLPTSVQQAGVTDQRVSIRRTPTGYTLSLVHDGQRWDLPSAAADSTYMRSALGRLGFGPQSR